MELQIPLDRKV